MDTTVSIAAHFFNRVCFSAPSVVPAPANASGIVRHAPQKFSLITIYYLNYSCVFVFKKIIAIYKRINERTRNNNRFNTFVF